MKSGKRIINESINRNIRKVKATDITSKGDVQLCYDFNDVKELVYNWVKEHLGYGIKIIDHRTEYDDNRTKPGCYFVIDENHTTNPSGFDYGQHVRFACVKDYWSWDLNFMTVEDFKIDDEYEFSFSSEEGFVLFFGLNCDGGSNGWYVCLDKDFNYHYCDNKTPIPVISYKDVDEMFIKRLKLLYIAYSLNYTSSDFKILTEWDCEKPYIQFSQFVLAYYKDMIENGRLEESVGSNIKHTRTEDLEKNADKSIIDYKPILTEFLMKHHNYKHLYRSKHPFYQYGIIFGQKVKQLFPGWKMINFQIIMTDDYDDFYFQSDLGIGYGHSGTFIKENIDPEEYQDFLKKCYEYCKRIVDAHPEEYHDDL